MSSDVRPIDANALRKKLLASSMQVHEVFNAIWDAPTLDLAPVKSGEWRVFEAHEGVPDAWACSVCGEPYYILEGTPAENNYNFCPNCGADMRGTS